MRRNLVATLATCSAPTYLGSLGGCASWCIVVGMNHLMHGFADELVKVAVSVKLLKRKAFMAGFKSLPGGKAVDRLVHRTFERSLQAKGLDFINGMPASGPKEMIAFGQSMTIGRAFAQGQKARNALAATAVATGAGVALKKRKKKSKGVEKTAENWDKRFAKDKRYRKAAFMAALLGGPKRVDKSRKSAAMAIRRERSGGGSMDRHYLGGIGNALKDGLKARGLIIDGGVGVGAGAITAAALAHKKKKD